MENNKKHVIFVDFNFLNFFLMFIYCLVLMLMRSFTVQKAHMKASVGLQI